MLALRNQFYLLLICASIFYASTAAQAQEQKITVQSSEPALTIYNQNFFVAREKLSLDLHSGVKDRKSTRLNSSHRH